MAYQVFVIINLFCFLAWANAPTLSISARRDSGVDFTQYLNEARKNRFEAFGFKDNEDPTPDEMAESYNPEKQYRAQKVLSFEDLNELFFYSRDQRFMKDENDFLRRPSWLYPDDGCFARAAVTNGRIKKNKNLLLNKIFVFGNLKVVTENSPRGKVSWWYHVAPVAEVGDDLYIIDPAIKTESPLSLREWLTSMAEESDLTNLMIAICDGRSYDPNDSCLKPKESYQRGLAHQKVYFSKEWQRQIDLGRDPDRTLGENPPWRIGLKLTVAD